MKKIYTFMMVFLLSFMIVSAASDTLTSRPNIMKFSMNETGDGMRPPMNGSLEDSERFGNITETQEMAKNMIKNMNQLSFSNGNGSSKFKYGNHTAECKGCNLSEENGKLQAKMSNGQNSEIKVMPDEANERALERLQLKSCDGNCSMELKEVGKGDNTKMAYEVKTQKQAKLFGIFGTKIKVQAQVDAESGEVIQSKKSWWAFMASEEDETEDAE